jgi:ubiquinone/menaquinone biosynthesis C-methylase UbiE
MAANFNNSAWFYDQLARLVYGRALVNAQVYLIQQITENSRVLIVGGGTGWILEQISMIHPKGLDMVYVEISANMMALSQKRNIGGNKVVFVNDAIENADLLPGFDFVLTPFLLDNFTEENLRILFNSIDKLLKKDGTWLNASFQLTGKWWQWVLLKTMFVFFRLICNVEASKLPDIGRRFADNEYTLVEQKGFFGDFMGSRVYKKSI